MQPLNQKIFVYGFVTKTLGDNSTDYDDSTGLLSLEYSMHIRAKNANDETWSYLNDDDEPY